MLIDDDEPIHQDDEWNDALVLHSHYMTGGCFWGTLAFKNTPHSALRIHLVFRECAWRFLWPVLTSSAPLVFITRPFDIEYSWCLGKLRLVVAHLGPLWAEGLKTGSQNKLRMSWWVLWSTEEIIEKRPSDSQLITTSVSDQLGGCWRGWREGLHTLPLPRDLEFVSQVHIRYLGDICFSYSVLFFQS